MITILAHNITSPLGSTSQENIDAVLQGRTAIHNWTDRLGVPCAFTASLFDESFFEKVARQGCSRFESLAISSAQKAIASAGVDVADGKTLFILSSTKGNIEWLGAKDVDQSKVALSYSASVIANAVGITTEPIVVDTACISGLSAIITASRLLEMGVYDKAVVCGVEVQSKFIISGFQSLKAMSTEACRPFDIDRNGLNLGEAAATIVLSNKADELHPWHIVNGCVKNDAFHLSAPSRTAEGAYEALTGCLQDWPKDDIAFVNAHGTATLFNDQMESVAIERAGLNSIPVNGFKGYYGHTMGACGVLETILSLCSIDRGVIIPTKGFNEIGVSGKINVVKEAVDTDKESFVKMLSGFGGGNAAIVVSKNNEIKQPNSGAEVKLHTTHSVHLTENSVTVDGKNVDVSSHGKSMLTELYKRYVGSYPKFYKMDIQSRLGLIATELLLNAEETGSLASKDSHTDNGGCKKRFEERSDRAIMLVGHSGCLLADENYLQSICNTADYYPSPERFVYTLPNIVIGEIAIRNHYHGETGFYLLNNKNEKIIQNIILTAFEDSSTKSVVGGWIECESENKFEAEICIYSL